MAGQSRNIVGQILIYSFTLFVSCMVCHGELARLKPGPAFLTSFYLMVALGGAVGGALVALVFPHLFRGFWEYHLGLWASAGLFFLVLAREKDSWLYQSRFGLAGIAVAASLLPGCVSVVMFGKQDLGNLFPVLPVLVGVYFLTRRSKEGFRSGPSAGRAFLLRCGAAGPGRSALFQRSKSSQGFRCCGAKLLWRSHREGAELGSTRLASLCSVPWPNRSWISVSDRIKARLAFRLLRPHKWRGPGVGWTPGREAKAETPQNLRIGVVGLGVGTLASYGRAGDYIRFYEINPEVTRIANEYFTYLKDCRASLDVIPGDARLSMERELKHDQPNISICWPSTPSAATRFRSICSPRKHSRFT